MRKTAIFVMAVCAVFAGGAMIAACGKSGEDKDSREKPIALEDLARKAMRDQALELEAGAFETRLERAGFAREDYDNFPVVGAGVKGRVLLYKEKSGRNAGGIIFFKKTASEVAPSWHWYFPNIAPRRVEKTEINGDGFWDLRVTGKDGKVIELIQEETFTLMAPERTDWIAMNGTASEPLSPDDRMWKCFDGDTLTAWSASLRPTGEAFLEIPVPFGVDEGILTMRTLSTNQPKHLKILADGKLVGDLDLEAKEAWQMIRLKESVRGAKSIRVVIGSGYGDGGEVSIAELTVR